MKIADIDHLCQRSEHTYRYRGIAVMIGAPVPGTVKLWCKPARLTTFLNLRHFVLHWRISLILVWLESSWLQFTGLEKSAAIRPFATKKSRLASENILLADSLATESCRFSDRLATKLFSKRTTPMRTERDRAMSLADVGPRCKGVGRSGPSMVFASKPTPGV